LNCNSVIIPILGTKLLIGFSLLAGKFSTKSDEPLPQIKVESTYIAPLILNSSFEATNCAEMSVTGSAKAKQKINSMSMTSLW